MKFGLRNLILLVTFIAVLLGLVQNGNQMLGRHLLIAALVFGSSFALGSAFAPWKKIRLWCGAGGLLGAMAYGLIAFCLKVYIYRTPSHLLLQIITVPLEVDSSYMQLWYRESGVVLLASGFVGAAIGPLLILVMQKHELSENDNANRNISCVLLGLAALCYFLAVADRWQGNYLLSNWMQIFFAILLVFVVFTIPWVGKHFQSLNEAEDIS